jgi:hypothetical protein
MLRTVLNELDGTFPKWFGSTKSSALSLWQVSGGESRARAINSRAGLVDGAKGLTPGRFISIPFDPRDLQAMFAASFASSDETLRSSLEPALWELVEKHLQVSECGRYRDTKTLTETSPIALRAL